MAQRWIVCAGRGKARPGRRRKVKLGLSPCCNFCTQVKIKEHGGRFCQLHGCNVLVGNVCGDYVLAERLVMKKPKDDEVRRGMRIVARLWKRTRKPEPVRCASRDMSQVIVPAMMGQYPAERLITLEDGTVKREVHLGGGYYVEAAKTGPDGDEPSGC